MPESPKNITEQDFLRGKTTAVYESETTVVDKQTGEILRQEKATKKKTSTEPDFIKIYYQAMMAVNEIDEIPLSFLLSLSSTLGYANGDIMYFYNNKTIRRAICEYCDIKDNMCLKYIRRCVDKGILFSTEDRGTYEVNPWLIAKGRWEKIKELQTRFSFVAGKWERIITESEGETPTESEEEASA